MSKLISVTHNIMCRGNKQQALILVISTMFPNNRCFLSQIFNRPFNTNNYIRLTPVRVPLRSWIQTFCKCRITYKNPWFELPHQLIDMLGLSRRLNKLMLYHMKNNIIIKCINDNNNIMKLVYNLWTVFCQNFHGKLV